MFYVHDLHQKYGPVVRIAPSEVAVNDIMAFKEIHKPGSGFTKTHFYETLPVGHKIGVFGVFAMRDLKAHALRRKLFARAFSKSFLRQNWEPLVLEKVQLAMRQIKGELQQGSCDVMKWFLLLAGDVSTHLMFGESFHTLESGEVNAEVFSLGSSMVLTDTML
jgi:cytochrome P450